MKISQNYQMFNRCIVYMFKTILKTSRTYIYMVVVPIILITFVYFFWYQQMLKTNRYIMISSFTLIPTLFLLFLGSFIICEWRDSVFLKYLKNFGLNKLQFMASLLIVLFTITFVIIWLIVGYLFLIDLAHQEHIVQNWFNFITLFSQWFGWIFGIILNILLMFFLAFLVAGSLKNIYIVQTINILIFILSFLFGDFLIDLSYATTTPAIIIGYFIPQKYITWIVYIFYTQSNYNSNGFFLIVPSVDRSLAFTSIYQPIFGTLIFISTISIGSYFTFVSGFKR